MKTKILFLIFCFPLTLLAKQTDSSLTKKIDKTIATFGENVNIGVFVQDAATGKVLYRKNADRYFRPASNEKLFTGFAALRYLGSNFTYKTNLFAETTKIQNGALNDHIYLQFSGDPSLTFAQLDHLINALSRAGIKRIQGKIMVDDTAFDRVDFAPGTAWEDKYSGDAHPLSGFILEENLVTGTITPAAKPDLPATITLPNYPQFMYFVNHVMTRAATATDCSIKSKPLNENTYTVEGCIKVNDPPYDLTVAINDPRSYLQLVLDYLFKKNQIVVQLPILFQKVPVFAKLLASETSPPLKALVTKMEKESSNVIADALFKTVGSVYFHDQGTWENGSEALHAILFKTAQLNLPKKMLIDGSGLSEYDYLMPSQIAALLRKVYLLHDPIFIAALPISGVDGTLKARMTEPSIRGKIYAKTGTETGVTTLSGYAKTRQNRWLIFSIMINGFVDPPAKYKVLEDRICGVLVS